MDIFDLRKEIDRLNREAISMRAEIERLREIIRWSVFESETTAFKVKTELHGGNRDVSNESMDRSD